MIIIKITDGDRLNLLQATGMLVTNKILHLPLKKQINGSDIIIREWERNLKRNVEMLVNFTQLYFATPFRRIEIIPIDIIYLYV